MTESSSSQKQPSFLPALALTARAFFFTALLRTIDIRAVGPENSSVGFATINSLIHDAFPYDVNLYQLTEKLGLIPFALTALILAFILVSFFTKRFAIKDKKAFIKLLLCLGGFYFAVLAIYIIFEKVIVLNFRPVILDSAEGLEPSYPSSHTFFALSLCGSLILVLKQFFSDQYPLFVKLGRPLLALLALAIVFGRFLSGVHWFTDIIGGALFAATLVAWLAFSLAHFATPHKAADSNE